MWKIFRNKKICEATRKLTMAQKQKQKPNTRKILKCANCGKAFTVKTELKNHGRVHTGKMPHNCKLCDKAFNTRKTLRMLSSNPS